MPKRAHIDIDKFAELWQQRLTMEEIAAQLGLPESAISMLYQRRWRLNKSGDKRFSSRQFSREATARFVTRLTEILKAAKEKNRTIQASEIAEKTGIPYSTVTRCMAEARRRILAMEQGSI